MNSIKGVKKKKLIVFCLDRPSICLHRHYLHTSKLLQHPSASPLLAFPVHFLQVLLIRCDGLHCFSAPPSLCFGAPRLCLGRALQHTVLRGRGNHVGNLSASSDGEQELSSPAVVNCRSEPKAAMELLGRMHRSPE